MPWLLRKQKRLPAVPPRIKRLYFTEEVARGGVGVEVEGGALVCLKYFSFMDLAEYKEKEMPEDVWNIFSFGVFVLICKECKSFLMLK